MKGRPRSCVSFLRSVMILVWGFGFVFIPLAGGCSHMHPKTDGQAFQGQVVYKDFEGGFFGIVTDAGERLNPVNLAPECRQNGLRVQGTYRPLEGTVTIQMWGQPVELLQITCQEDDAPDADRY